MLTEEEIQALNDELASSKVELETTRTELAGVRTDMQKTEAALETAQVEAGAKLETSLSENQALQEKLALNEG